MFEKIKLVSALRVIGFLFSGVVAAACATGPDGRGTISDGNVVRWVEKTIAERQPTAQDKLFDRIAWVTDIRTAIQLGKQHNRPIFLSNGDGRINTGRC
jgi:hypothetical protein